MDDDTHGLITIANGTSFSFHDYFYDAFKTFMSVRFTDTQINRRPIGRRTRGPACLMRPRGA